MTPRMCDGQPRYECPSGCTDSCDFNNADLADRARHMAAEVFYEPEYGRAPLPRPSLRIRVFDWLGDGVMAVWAIVSHPWAWIAAGLVVGSAFVAAALTALVVMR